MKKLDYIKMQNVTGGLQNKGVALLCLTGVLVSCFGAIPLGLMELAACGYTVYSNW